MIRGGLPGAAVPRPARPERAQRASQLSGEPRAMRAATGVSGSAAGAALEFDRSPRSGRALDGPPGGQCPTRAAPSRSRRFRRRAWMISSMTMTAMLNKVTMMIDSQSVIAASLADRRGLRLDHRAPRRLPPLAQDEAGADVRGRHRQQRLGADDA